MLKDMLYFSLGVLAILLSQDNPKILKVPDDFRTIQAAMSRAEAGDTISVGKGTYAGNIVLKAGVSLIGGNPEFTRIQGDGRGDVVIAADKAIISGFTIEASGPLYCAIRCDSVSPVIKNNVIVHNGAGILMAESNAVIETNLIVENDDGSDFGTVALLCRGGKPRIRNNTIANNHARFALLCDHSCPEVAKNLIAFNLGGVACANGSRPLLIQNDLWANTLRGDYNGCSPGRDSLSEDPQFVDMKNGDYRLSSDSPCLKNNRNIGMGGHKITRK
jgi:hypothetical protein